MWRRLWKCHCQKGWHCKPPPAVRLKLAHWPSALQWGPGWSLEKWPCWGPESEPAGLHHWALRWGGCLGPGNTWDVLTHHWLRGIPTAWLLPLMALAPPFSLGLCQVRSESENRVRLFVTPWTVAAYQAPPSMGFSRPEYWVLEWLAISFSRGSSLPRDQTQVSHTAGRRFTLWAIREAWEYWSG